MKIGDYSSHNQCTHEAINHIINEKVEATHHITNESIMLLIT